MNLKNSQTNSFPTNESTQPIKPAYNKNYLLKKFGVLKAFLFLLALSASVSAATYTVTTTADNELAGCGFGQCTLREAINGANFNAGNDTIIFNPGVTGTITLNSGLGYGYLPITSNITITGPGARTLAISGNNTSRVFAVSGTNAVASISGLTITGGNAQLLLIGGSLLGDGGGILNTNGGTLNLTECAVTGNSAASLGGGVATSAVLLVETTTNITRSLISNNTAILGGGGISNFGTALLSTGKTNISNSTITNNNALAEGGGISNAVGEMNLTNNTISHNQSLVAGGGMVNVGGILVGIVSMRNNILAQNHALLGTDLISSDALGIFNSLGHNLIGDNLSVGVSFGASLAVGGIAQPNVNLDLVGSVDVGYQSLDPMLGPLADNGGPTNTRLLGVGSPALDRGANCVVTNTCTVSLTPAALTTDQRGISFTRQIDGNGNGNATVDIGAFESQSVPTGTTYTVTNLTDATPNGCTVNDCTLREAILDANANPGPDTINFTNGLNGSIPLSSAFGQLAITSDINIDGPGARIISVNGGGTNRVFLVTGDETAATIKGLTITNGNAPLLGTLLGDGGGVLNVGGSTLNLVEVNVSGNYATSLGGGVATRSLLGETSKTYITRSLLSNNRAFLGGGGISNIATLNLIGSAVTTASNSTITLNHSLAEAGGISNIGGTINLTNDTITDNTSVITGGGVVNVAGILGLGVTNLRNTMIARNNAVVVGGILSLSDDVLGIFHTLGNNLIGSNFNAEASFEASVFVGIDPLPNINADIVGSISVGSVIDPKVGALLNNGGQTDTRAIMPGSPALNRGNNCVLTDSCATDPNSQTLPEALATDQRGTGYSRRTYTADEIGAFEQQLSPTAADIQIAGRVLDESGNPISKITVTLTDMSGNVRRAATNQFGNYRFNEIPAGETYVVLPTHHKYSFTAQVISLSEDVADLEFRAGQ